MRLPFSFDNPRVYYGILIVISLCSILLIISNPILVSNDSEGYIKMYIIRSPGYPLFLKGIFTIFQDNYAFGTKLIQGILGISAIHFLVHTIRRHNLLAPIWLIGFFLILAIPYLYNHQVANNLLSMALSYPLYLIIVAFFFNYLIFKKAKHLLYASPIIILLLLTRSQFLFLIPVGVFLTLWILRKNLKKAIIPLSVLILIPILVNTSDSLYHKVVHGNYATTPFTGIHLLSPLVFITNEQSENLFQDPVERRYFNVIMEELKRKQLNRYYLPNNLEPMTVFTNNYSAIANHTIYSEGYTIFSEKTHLSEFEIIQQIDKTTKRMCIPILKKEFTRWVKFYLSNISHGLFSANYFLFYVMLLLFCIYYIKNPSFHFEISTLVILLLFGNILIVALGVHTIKRYLFYNNWVLFFIIFLSFNFIQKKLAHGN
ncbi:MAG: hypothetical protein CL596_07285 [Alteromonas sp.]|nr:hypothetical protein [Alteromonas sp.]